MPPFVDHPARRAAEAELHARPIAPIQGPARIRRVAFLFGQDHELARESRNRMIAFWSRCGIAPPAPEARRFDFEAGVYKVTWEFHTEFSTATWTAPFDDRDPWPAGIGLQVMADTPVALAVRVDLLSTEFISKAALAGFDERSLCYSTVEHGRAQAATDFRADAGGYTRYELAAGSLGPYFAGALVRRILEIETYRVLALFGIDLARAEAPRLSEIETQVAARMSDIATSSDPRGSAVLLDALHAFQLHASQSVERTRYRFAASHAYGDILMQRLRDLGERAHGEHWTMQGYLRQRVEPALATFTAIERRQAALLDQTARSTALLGTRISLDIDTQNRSILGTISDTAKGQYRLQRTVEGLSTIAITYYVLGVVSYASHGLAPAYDHEKSLAIAVFAPVVLVSVWLYLRRMQKH